MISDVITWFGPNAYDITAGALDQILNEPAHEILAHTAFAQTPPFNARADVTSKARGLKFGLSLHLLQCFVYASSEGFGETTHNRISTDSPEPSLLAVISCAGPTIAYYVNYTESKGSLTLAMGKMPMVFSKIKSLSIVSFFIVKLP